MLVWYAIATYFPGFALNSAIPSEIEPRTSVFSRTSGTSSSSGDDLVEPELALVRLLEELDEVTLDVLRRMFAAHFMNAPNDRRRSGSSAWKGKDPWRAVGVEQGVELAELAREAAWYDLMLIGHLTHHKDFFPNHKISLETHLSQRVRDHGADEEVRRPPPPNEASRVPPERAALRPTRARPTVILSHPRHAWSRPSVR